MNEMHERIRNICVERSFRDDCKQLVVDIFTRPLSELHGAERTKKLIALHTSKCKDSYVILHDAKNLPLTGSVDWEFRKFVIELDVPNSDGDVDLYIKFLDNQTPLIRNNPTQVYDVYSGTIVKYSYQGGSLTLYFCDKNKHDECWFFYYNQQDGHISEINYTSHETIIESFNKSIKSNGNHGGTGRD